MALVIYNNTYSLAAQSALNKTSLAQGNIIKQLSTGLRINSAADDASGLAISEKLRGQILGLKRAQMNAQDGVSYLQTVDGAMGEVSNMLNRVRELAVQAGSGIYTTTDRAVLQLEVDQLKDEINRVSRASEFNTKKLLNGDATAVWSSDRPFVKGIVRGPTVIEGNYQIDANVTPGSNSIYKSNIMGINKGTLVAEITGRIGAANLAAVRDPINMPLTGNGNLRATVGTNAAAANQSAAITQTYKQAGSNWTPTALTPNNIDVSGYFEVEFISNGAVSADLSGVVTFKYRAMDAKTGLLSNWITTSSTTGAAAPHTSTFTINLRAAGISNNVAADVTFTLLPTSTLKAGDKILGRFQPPVVAGNTWARSGGGTLQITGATTAYPRINYSAQGSLTKTNNGDNITDYNKVPYYVMNMDTKTGFVQSGSLTLEFREATAGSTLLTNTGSATIRIRDEGVATKDTKLANIKSFTTADGRSILALGQELRIYANGISASIYLEPNDKVEDLITKLTNALVKDLGLGADPNTAAGRLVNENLVKYVPAVDTTPNSDQAVAGTFVIQTAGIGTASDLTFIGEDALVSALNIATIKEGTNSNMLINVKDAHTGKFIGSDEVSDGVLRNVIKGMDVAIDQTLGLTYRWNDVTKRIDFIKSTANQTAYLHVVDTRTQLQIGANQGQTMNISVGQLDTTGLEIDNLYVVDLKTSQRAISQVDKALTTVNGLRATTGAYMNRLQYTIANLGTVRENLISAESRIRDLDIAAASTELAKNQVLMQAATAMIVQANAIPQQALTLIRGG